MNARSLAFLAATLAWLATLVARVAALVLPILLLVVAHVALPLAVVTPAPVFVTPSFRLDVPVLKQRNCSLVRRGIMRSKGAPAKGILPQPHAEGTPVVASSTSVPGDATDGLKPLIDHEKKETVGTLSSDARFTGQEEPEAKMSPRPTHTAHVERVVSVKVQVAIRSRLRNCGVRKQDIEDMAQQVTSELLFMADPPAESRREMHRSSLNW